MANSVSKLQINLGVNESKFLYQTVLSLPPTQKKKQFNIMFNAF